MVFVTRAWSLMKAVARTAISVTVFLFFPGYGTCSLFGSAEINSFDNKTYHYYTKCDHFLVDVPINGDNDKVWKVAIQPDKNCQPQGNCEKKLYMNFDGTEIELGKLINGEFAISVGNKEIKSEDLPYQNGLISIVVCDPNKLLFVRAVLSLECRKIKTKAIILTNQNRGRQSNKPIRI